MQTQLSVPLFVVKGDSAYTLIAANGGENEITAALSSLEADTERQGSAHCFTVLEIASRLNRSGAAALACAIAPTAPERSVSQSGGRRTARARGRGIAVFRGETLCGFLVPTPRSARILFSALRRRQATSSPTGAAAR